MSQSEGGGGSSGPTVVVELEPLNYSYSSANGTSQGNSNSDSKWLTAQKLLVSFLGSIPAALVALPAAYGSAMFSASVYEAPWNMAIGVGIESCYIGLILFAQKKSKQAFLVTALTALLCGIIYNTLHAAEVKGLLVRPDNWLEWVLSLVHGSPLSLLGFSYFMLLHSSSDNVNHIKATHLRNDSTQITLSPQTSATQAQAQNQQGTGTAEIKKLTEGAGASNSNSNNNEEVARSEAEAKDKDKDNQKPGRTFGGSTSTPAFTSNSSNRTLPNNYGHSFKARAAGVGAADGGDPQIGEGKGHFETGRVPLPEPELELEEGVAVGDNWVSAGPTQVGLTVQEAAKKVVEVQYTQPEEEEVIVVSTSSTGYHQLQDSEAFVRLAGGMVRQVQSGKLGVREFEGRLQDFLTANSAVAEADISPILEETRRLGRLVQKRELGVRDFDKQLSELLTPTRGGPVQAQAEAGEDR